jgi:iron(III) transport system permease protein
VLFSKIRIENIKEIFFSPQFFSMLKNSMVTSLVATIISVMLAFFLAYVILRTKIRYKSVWMTMFTVPMLIPSISHGMGLVLLFGDNGLLTNLLEIRTDLYGYNGIIIGSILYSFPVAFLMFFDSLLYEDYTAHEAASVLGISAARRFIIITIPSMKRTIVSAVLAVFTMVFTDYGVPLMTGGTVMTLPVYMYREVIGMMDFANGAVIGVILLVPAVIAFLIDLKKSNKTGATSTVTKKFQISENKVRDVLAYIFLTLVLICICLPVTAFLYLSFVKQYPIDMSFSIENIKKLVSNGIGMYFINSVTVALLTSLIGTIFSYFSAYYTARSQNKPSDQVLHFVSMLPLAIPGVVLGLSYVMTFNKIPLYSSIFILIVANIIHFFSSPYLMAYNSLIKFNPNLEDVAYTLGISKIRMLVSVYIPSTISTIVEMYSYFFVNSMITISAVSFLANFKTMPLSLMIPQLEAQSFIEGTALISLLILCLNLLEKGIAFFVKRHIALHQFEIPKEFDEANIKEE